MIKGTFINSKAEARTEGAAVSVRGLAADGAVGILGFLCGAFSVGGAFNPVGLACLASFFGRGTQVLHGGGIHGFELRRLRSGTFRFGLRRRAGSHLRVRSRQGTGFIYGGGEGFGGVCHIYGLRLRQRADFRAICRIRRRYTP